MKLHDDLINEIEPHESVEESTKALVLGIADRIEACHGSQVKLSDLCSVLREDPDHIGRAIVNNTPAAKTKTNTTGHFDAPSPAFEKPREGVRDGMVGANQNDHRDQVSPGNANTDAERERIRRENIAKEQGKPVVLNEPLPA